MRLRYAKGDKIFTKSKPSPSINSDTLKAMIILDKNKNPSSLGKQSLMSYMTRNIVMKQMESQASLKAAATAAAKKANRTRSAQVSSVAAPAAAANRSSASKTHHQAANKSWAGGDSDD